MKLQILLILCCVILLNTGCNNRKFKSEDEFKTWLNGKHFRSTSTDYEQTDYKGNLFMPVGTVDLIFSGNTIQYQSCSPQSYNIYQDGDIWTVTFEKCGKGDYFDLVVTPSGDYKIRSKDYDTSKKDMSSGSALERISAADSKKEVDGPTMEIVN
jgi:hypothetical protein